MCRSVPFNARPGRLPASATWVFFFYNVSMSYVGLLDCNNFFVSCERLFRPDLAKKPVVVLSSNDGCVVARSQEVKDLGIPMGVPHFKVRDEFKQHGVEVFSSNFQLYRDVSRRVMEVLEEEVGEIAQYSVDESFFNIYENRDGVVPLLRNAKAAIEAKVGVPVSLGAGKTMTIAKYASEKEKKGSGVCFLEGESWQRETEYIPVAAIWGIGGQTSRKLNELGIKTVEDLLQADRARMEKIFGIHGLRLQSELSEVPSRREHSEDEMQHSIMSTRSFAESTEKLSVVEDALSYHAAHATKELREMNGVASVVRIIMRPSRHGDWALRGGSAEVVLIEPTSDTRVILHEVLTLAKEIFEPGVPYKKAGVILSNIRDERYRQENLFSTEKQKPDNTLMKVMDTLNQKLGKDKITIGRVSSSLAWQSSRAHSSPRYTTSWNEIKTVRT